jgi:hypothetical protein
MFNVLTGQRPWLLYLYNRYTRTGTCIRWGIAVTNTGSVSVSVIKPPHKRSLALSNYVLVLIFENNVLLLLFCVHVVRPYALNVSGLFFIFSSICFLFYTICRIPFCYSTLFFTSAPFFV